MFMHAGLEKPSVDGWGFLTPERQGISSSSLKDYPTFNRNVEIKYVAEVFRPPLIISPFRKSLF